jgi:hypothetical protein
MRLDNASSSNQRALIHSRNFFLMTDFSLNRALGNSDYDWNWKGASKNFDTHEKLSLQVFNHFLAQIIKDAVL